MSLKTSQRIRSKRRSGEPWVSTNRVLIGNPASKKSGNFARNPNFDTDETKLLIQLWGDPKVQRTLITTHKKQAVIAQLATKMEDYGYYRSPEEITTRIKNLKCFYNRLKKEIESGQSTTMDQTWKHFVEMDAIMTRPIFSVRPNEVPAPSLRFQLEQAREEREARRKEILEAGGSMSGSEDGLEDLIALSNHQEEECVLSDVEIHFDDNESLSALVATNEPKSVLARARRGRKRRKLSKSQSESSLANASDYMGEPDGDALAKATDGPAIQIKDERSIDNAEFDGKSPEEEKEPQGQTNTPSNASAMLVPKEEPIDVDDDDDGESMDKVQQQSIQPSANIKGIMPSIADLLSMSQGSASAVLIPVSSMANMQSCAAVTTAVAPMSTATYTTATSRAQAGPQTPKISIVPANFLMHAAKSSAATSTTTSTGGAVASTVSQPQIHLLQNGTQLNGQQLTQRILLSSSGGQGSAAGATKAGIVTTGIGGMKVLLVNADQSASLGGAPQQISSASGHLSHQLTASNLQVNAKLSSPAVIQPTLQHTTATTQQQLRQPTQNKQRRQGEQKLYQPTQQSQQQEQQEELISKKEATSIRILLRNLLNVQMENNNIENQRLKLEREKFEFEKTCAERFFTVLPTLFTQPQFHQNPMNQSQTQPQPQHHLQLHLQKKPQQQLNTTQLRISAPPKLVFASTGAISSNLSINNGASATVIVPTTSNATGIISQAALATPTVTNGNLSNNSEPKILLTPKLEKED